ncbi:DUF4350 domain-containing protein [Streptomyces sp. NPDC052077]|uniref:DUF4350 domain-containing protein n=1 Tax=Streptomyces sp. NPDC052077 TaxID=3154757 RepID=UPI003427B7D2
MTTPTTPPATSVRPGARQAWVRARGIVLALVLLLAAAVVIALVRSDARHGALDPRSADPGGSRAVAELLADRGVATRVVTTLAEARAAAGPDTTLLVAVPDRLTEHQRTALRSTTARAGGRTVLVAPGDATVRRLAPGVTADPAPATGSPLAPDCALPAARRAGTADTGPLRYTSGDPSADACYPGDGPATLLRLPETSGGAGPDGAAGDTVVLGGSALLTNRSLADHGNASLALQLLGSRDHLVWYLPSLSDGTAADGERGFFDLLPSGWLWATLQLLVAAALAALWRARRLGPLVPERLPVVIRASETAEGRARLYRRADARDRAAAALRSAARTRLAPLVGVPLARAHTPEALITALTVHLHGDGRSLHTLLFGPPPTDDAALITLADRLDALESEVRRP